VDRQQWANNHGHALDPKASGKTRMTPFNDPYIATFRCVRIEVKAAAINPADLMFRDPGWPNMTSNIVPGMDAAGVIESVGLSVSRLHPGQKVILDHLTCILCVPFTRCLRIFEAVESTENYQTFLIPKLSVAAKPAIRSSLKVEVFVDEIVPTMALPEQSAFGRCPYYFHIYHIYHIFWHASAAGP
jgi:Alcohol dehydrogenase GroES-like domain